MKAFIALFFKIKDTDVKIYDNLSKFKKQNKINFQFIYPRTSPKSLTKKLVDGEKVKGFNALKINELTKESLKRLFLIF